MPDRSNPISLHHSGPVTDQQVQVFSLLLNQLASTLETLQLQITQDLSINQDEPAIEGWHYLLNDLATVILPEFYVVFKDKTTPAMMKRRLYDLAQAIYFAMVSYATSDFLRQLIAPSSTSIRPATNLLLLNKTDKKSTQPSDDKDDYLTGEGVNARIAYELVTITRFVTIDGFYYLDKFEPYYQLIITKKELLRALTEQDIKTFQAQLEDWQLERLTAFSVPTLDTVVNEPDLANVNTDHILATWVVQERLHIDSPANTINQQRTDIVKEEVYETEFIADYDHFIGGILIGSFALIFLNFISFSVLGVFLAGAFMLGGYLLKDGLNFYAYAPTIKKLSTVSILILGGFITLSLAFFNGFFTNGAIALLLLAVCLNYYSHHNIPDTPPVKKIPLVNDPNRLIMNDVYIGSYETLTKRFKAIRDAENFNTTTETPHTATSKDDSSKNYDLPLDIDRHGYHLALLLSENPTERFKQLIESANTLYDHIDYLQSTHPYLAAHVDELVKDLTDNTLVRLDEMASYFVKEGQVNSSAQALFREQHEARIDEVLTLNLTQVDDLNNTILEKQMAGFANFNNSAERQFRDTLMELKILLRWLVAQQPDDVQASSHQVILNNLEKSTLADMQAVFFDAQTNNVQRAELQQQLEQLLTHFKQQNTQPYANSEDDSEIQALLQLSKPDKQTVSDTDIDTANSQAEKQQFIDYNNQYIKQLLKHWH